MNASILIVGLGNPGEEYRSTRHNVGFHVIDKLAYSLQCNLTLQKSCKALVAKHNFSTNASCILAKPTTFMNLSGQSVYALLRWYSIPPYKCIVITDNIDLPVGTLRVKQKGEGGTHNGIRSVHTHLQSLSADMEYIRLYLGVGSHRGNQNLAKYVLGKWHSSEDSSYEQMFAVATTAITNSVCNFSTLTKPIKFGEFLARNVASAVDATTIGNEERTNTL